MEPNTHFVKFGGKKSQYIRQTDKLKKSQTIDSSQLHGDEALTPQEVIADLRNQIDLQRMEIKSKDKEMVPHFLDKPNEYPMSGKVYTHIVIHVLGHFCSVILKF
mgnify:CR=1 FL=1